MPEEKVIVNIGPGKDIEISTGKIAKLANGSCTLRLGDTTVLVAACFGAVWVAVAVSLALLFVTVSLWLVSPFANPESRGPEAFVRTAQNFCEKIIVRNITMSKKYVIFITEKKQ